MKLPRCPVMEREVAHLDVALRYCRSFRTAVDGGAHVGLWSRKLAERFDRVVAFEPYAPHVDELRHVPGIEVHGVALGASDGVVILEPGGQNDGQWHVSVSDDVAVCRAAAVHRLDDHRFEDVDFLKLDVEGYEFYALLGAKRVLALGEPVVMIEENGLSERYGVGRGAAGELLTGFGYRLVERLNKDELWIPGHW